MSDQQSETPAKRPTIFLPGQSSNHATLHDQLAPILAASGHWFESGGALVELSADRREHRLIRHSAGSIIPALERLVSWAKWRLDAPQGVPAALSVPVTRTIVESQAFAMRMPRVRFIADFEIPYPDPEDRVLFTAAGYTAACQCLQPPGAVVPLELSTDEARAHWSELVADFPFGSLADMAAYACYLLTPYLRLLFDGPAPLFLISANTPRAGKDCLALIVHLVFAGTTYDLPMSGSRFGSEEEEKRFATALISGRRLIHYPNLFGTLRATWLERLVTQRDISVRILGTSNEVHVANTFTISASGNSDFRLAGDFAPRCIPISLMLDDQDPNARTFARPDLPAWTLANRMATLGMCKRFLLDWLAADCPQPAAAFASFPAWWRTVGAVASHALGIAPDLSRSSVQADPRVAGLGYVLQVFGNPLHPEREGLNDLGILDPTDFTAADIMRLAAAMQKHDPDLLEDFPLASPEFSAQRSAQTRFGRLFHARAGVPTGGITYSPISEARPARRRYKLKIAFQAPFAPTPT